MSEAKKVTDPNEELVEYTAPLMGRTDSRDIIVGVNGEIIRIMRGETVQMEAYKAQMAAQKNSAKALADM